MPVQIEAFLDAYTPKFICICCLAAVTSRDETDVRGTVQMLLAERRAETRVGECMMATLPTRVGSRPKSALKSAATFRCSRTQVPSLAVPDSTTTIRTFRALGWTNVVPTGARVSQT